MPLVAPLLLMLSRQTSVRIAEVAFLLVLIAGVWLVAAEVLTPRFHKMRMIVVGSALAVWASSSSSPPIGDSSADLAFFLGIGARTDASSVPPGPSGARRMCVQQGQRCSDTWPALLESHIRQRVA